MGARPSSIQKKKKKKKKKKEKRNKELQPTRVAEFFSKVSYSGACRICLPYPLCVSGECGSGHICMIKELMDHLAVADL